MCGIVGVLNFKNSSFRVTEPYLIRMRDTMGHRGPDGAGAWIADDGRIGLGHRRLSVIGLPPAAAHPPSSEHGSLWARLHGESYNPADIHRAPKAIGGHRGMTD